MLEEEPDIFSLKPHFSLKAWKKLAPLTVEEIMRNSEYEVSFTKDNIKYRKLGQNMKILPIFELTDRLSHAADT